MNMKMEPTVGYRSIARKNLEELREEVDSRPVEKVSVEINTGDAR